MPAGLIIEGPENFLARVKETLRFLENRSPEWYAYALSGLDKIRLVEGEGPNVFVHYVCQDQDMENVPGPFL